MDALILLADKKLRTKTLCWAALLAVLGLIIVRALLMYLDELKDLQAVAPQIAAEKYAQLLFLFGIATVLTACSAVGALGFIFYKALRTEHFPPPGIRFMWDTKLRTGNEARRIAIVGMAAAVAIALCAIALGMMMISIARTPIFGHTGPFLEASIKVISSFGGETFCR